MLPVKYQKFLKARVTHSSNMDIVVVVVVVVVVLFYFVLFCFVGFFLDKFSWLFYLQEISITKGE